MVVYNYLAAVLSKISDRIQSFSSKEFIKQGPWININPGFCPLNKYEREREYCEKQLLIGHFFLKNTIFGISIINVLQTKHLLSGIRLFGDIGGTGPGAPVDPMLP